MSVGIETTIFCNVDAAQGCPGSFYLHDIELKNFSAKKQRESYRNYGWHYHKGKDICPSCWEAGFRE